MKLRQEQIMLDQKKEQHAEMRTKDEASAETKVKAFQKRHDTAGEEEAAAKVKVENAEANQQLAASKFAKADADKKAKDALLEQAKMRLKGATDAQIAKASEMKGAEKKYDDARQEVAIAATPAIAADKKIAAEEAKKLLNQVTDVEKR